MSKNDLAENLRAWPGFNTAIGSYQSLHTAEKILGKLRKNGFRYAISLQNDEEGIHSDIIDLPEVLKGLLQASCVSFLIMALSLSSLGLPASLVLGSIPFFIALGYFTWLYYTNKTLCKQYQNMVIRDETLVIALVRETNVLAAMDLLRSIEAYYPASFLLRVDTMHWHPPEIGAKREALPQEDIQAYATQLGADLHSVKVQPGASSPLLRLKNSTRTLKNIIHRLEEAQHIEQNVSTSANWLLDNAYVIEENSKAVQRGLPSKFYRQLPRLTAPDFKGRIRVDLVAEELIHCTGHILNRDNIISFLKSYLAVSSLTIGELWALPLFLRLVLLESLEQQAIELDRRVTEEESASFWENRLSNAARIEPERLELFLNHLKQVERTPSPHFAEELIEHLFEADVILPPIKAWIEEVLGSDMNHIIQKEQQEEAQNGVKISSAIVSLITLSQLSWKSVFESVSTVAAILNEDPSQSYAAMNSFTKDSYLHVIETLSKRSHYTEDEVAKLTVKMAEQGVGPADRHVGYYLIDDGLEELETSLNYSPTRRQLLHRFIINHSTLIYFGAIATLVLLMEGVLFTLSTEKDSAETLLFLTLSLLPASEVAIQIINTLLSHILPPHILPKMNFEEGIPPQYKTLVIIPCMLTSQKSTQDIYSRLEIHYLANDDPALKFGVLFDYADAAKASRQEDQKLLDDALVGIQALERKYGANIFFLFLRERLWNPSEATWIGWERKRGKLENLNRFLIEGSYSGEFLRFGRKEELMGIHFVLTLDVDTQLPKGRGQQLVETLAHPLNAVQLSPANHVKRGYSIIQPRVLTDFAQSKKTVFSRIFADFLGLDPYTQAISDVYQDLMHEGTYHGKCLYDVQAFNRILTGCFPENHLLSHDLLEGAYVRVGYASDISLYDNFPENYWAWCKRQHRWMRGDWQIIDWLFDRVPAFANQWKLNPLSEGNRWKILDNLRRALLPVTLTALLLYAWLFSSTPALGSALVALVLLLPSFITALQNVSTYLHSMRASWKSFWLGGLRAIINAAFLPHQALLSLDALFRVIYRRLISHQFLLEWSTDNQDTATSPTHLNYRLFGNTFFGACAFCLTAYFNTAGLPFALPFCLLFTLSPGIASLLQQKSIFKTLSPQHLQPAERKTLRKIARKTWRYFDDFVSEESQWLPPDNFQAALRIEVAERTSPTNIGLWLLSALSAYDLKYTTCDDTVTRLLATFQSLNKLEFYQGHLLNWYNTRTLEPLHPKYVSTVDSGNFLASLWTFQQGIKDLIISPVLPLSFVEGLEDTFNVYLDEKPPPLPSKQLYLLQEALKKRPNSIAKVLCLLENCLHLVQTMLQEKEERGHYWLKALEKQLLAWRVLHRRYFEWMDLLGAINTHSFYHSQQTEGSALPFTLIDEMESLNPSLHELAEGTLFTPLYKWLAGQENLDLPKETIEYTQQLKKALEKAQWLAGEKIGEALSLIEDAHEMSEKKNISFLYSSERKLFSIGYHVEQCQRDNSFYDLLASEARISSLVAIAKGDVPLEHWWALGRPYKNVGGVQILLSWGGTMFEYLMPLLFTKYYSDSLLGNACQNAVKCQIAYGQQRDIPWGISESAFSEIDARKIYQYRSFGVPQLGFKAGLENDLVVSPYSSLLSLSIAPKEVLKNLKTLSQGRTDLYAPFGYYEAIDFTRQDAPSGEPGSIVYAYMAHHQGMSLLAINNSLNHNVMIERFHRDPRIKGVESLLYERIPLNPPATKGKRPLIPLSRLVPLPSAPSMGMIDTPHSPMPKINLLANGEYSVMLTNAGGGYSRWKDFDITRWRSDSTSDHWGSFCYIKNCATGEFWSTTYQPTYTKGQKFAVHFKPDKVEFRRQDNHIDTSLEVVVAPQENVEIRLVTLANLSNHDVELELTSYSELSLAPHRADQQHPCFNKLFIQTEALPELSGVLAFRRLRSPSDVPIWAGHLVAAELPSSLPFQCETDRSQFIGRGNNLAHPSSMQGDLKNSQGYTLDPIFSIRHHVHLKRGMRTQVAFVTVVAESRESALALMKKYQDIALWQHTQTMAWTYSQLELRHLRIHQEEAQVFQRVASYVLYPHSHLRPFCGQPGKSCLDQSALWAYSISGDLPIITVTVANGDDLDLVKQMLTAHAFWRMRGLKVDLVILNAEITSYEHPLQNALMRFIHSHAAAPEIGKPGGVYVLSSEQIPLEIISLILAVACAHFVGSRGYLRHHLSTPMKMLKLPPRLTIKDKTPEEPSRALPFLELSFFNGFGGYLGDGKEYVIYLPTATHTPAPWVNVLANPHFGTMVSETGLGTTWYGNSQTNRLTPWSNDPLLNPISDLLYIRDERRATFWNPTPAPIRELDAYRVRHGQGYSLFEHNSHAIEQELLIFVPTDDQGGAPLRIQLLTLTNASSHSVALSVFAFTELVLGTDKENTQLHITTCWDVESQSIFATNFYNGDYGNHVAFISSTITPKSYTGDRTEFIGRNHPRSNPAALKRTVLSNTTGAGLDPCAALQVCVELAPGEKQEVAFLLGYAPDVESARAMALKWQSLEHVKQNFDVTKQWWERLLETVQIETPEPYLNIAMNRWLLYQDLSCRLFGRTAFYQSSGAFGFRDQLQDCLALTVAYPQIARRQIILAASRQFPEGDVQHWWHPPKGGGVRTRISDDLLWLPFTVAHYVRVTNDLSILEEEIPFINGPLLKENEHETFFTPEPTQEKASLWEHCRRALAKGSTAGPHGLPLIGGGDWNDGMNLVGAEGQGESVWLAWFLIHVLQDFAFLLTASGEADKAAQYVAEAKRLATVVENSAWDGKWYRRAYFDDGTPLGSELNDEDFIDALPQAWAVLCGLAKPDRASIALSSVEQHLVRAADKLILLLTPPFDKTNLQPGYIKGYPPGVRENGGQYTHGSLWVPMAFARLGNGDTAAELLKMMHPQQHALTKEAASHYKIEPYVTAGDVYALPGQVGKGGWSWYTGSQAWMYRIWLEEILGFQLRGNRLKIVPSLPKAWVTTKIRYRYHSTFYVITIEFFDSDKNEILTEHNGCLLSDGEIILVDDQQPHAIHVRLPKPL